LDRDGLAELMAADPRVPEAHWAAPIPDGCPELAGLPLDDSVVPMADDHCAPADHPVRDERSADSARDDSVVPMADDRCAPADHPVRDERSADSALDDSVVPMDDHYAPADHPVPAEHSARADSVVDGYSAHYFPADCWRRADLPGADSRRGGRLPVVLLEPVPG
jgi:hypothetical protein